MCRLSAKLSINYGGKVPPPSDETGEGQAEPELAVLQAPFKETGVATPEKIKTFFTAFRGVMISSCTSTAHPG